MTIEKPTPDGSLTLHFRDGEVKTIPFLEMDTHRPDPHGTGYIIHRGDSRDWYPYMNLTHVTINYNSPEYQDQYNAWMNEEHQTHLSFDDEGNVNWLSEECPLCIQARMASLAAQAIENMGLIEDTDGE